jgi:hypothetical protein
MSALRAISPLRVFGAASLVGASLCFAAAISLDGGWVWLFACAGLVFAGLSHRITTSIAQPGRVADPRPVPRQALASTWQPRPDEDPLPVSRPVPQQTQPREALPATSKAETTGPEKSLEALHADLARLREGTKGRPSVAPPGFLDTPTPAPVSRPPPEESFPKTEFSGLSGLAPAPTRRSEEADFPRTEIAGLTHSPLLAPEKLHSAPEPVFPRTEFAGLEPGRSTEGGAEEWGFQKTQFTGPA